jgi:hypothetical protein
VHRREVLKLLAMSSALPAMPAELLAAFRGVHASLGAAPELKLLNLHQDATVTALAELIIPQTETPGAKAARVNEFIDLILAEWSADEERKLFLSGLADLDTRTRTFFGKNFVDASHSQQSEIARALGEELAQESAALAAAPRGYRGADPELVGNFYFMFRDLTLTGYFTSEIGFTQQLHEEIVPGHYDGCAPAPAANPAPPKGP